MPRVRPFAALRYAPGVATDLAALICPPYDVISDEEQAQLLAQSPYNAVALELPSDAPAEPGSRYALAAERLAQWRRDNVLLADQRLAYYLSSTTFSHAGQTLERKDLIAT
ncbi:MAG TPA: DUF1015 family protein, partial [Chloroflexota bacterium]|nr:DUF1015 family protein [Chloroflexota bacterium]